MTGIVLHADRAGSPSRPVGKPVVGSLPDRNDPVQVARQARALLQSGRWRRSTRTGSDDQRADFLLQVAVPAALDLLPAAARHSLTRRPPAGGCSWCVCRALSALDGEPAPAPTESLLALLGEPCGRCRTAFAVAAAAQRAVDEYQAYQQALPAVTRGRPHLARALTASAQPHPPGSPPPLYVAMQRDVDRMGAQRTAARWGIPAGYFLGDRQALTAVARHPVFGVALRRPPGTPWPPAAEALRASLTRKTPPPPYWRPRPGRPIP